MSRLVAHAAQGAWHAGGKKGATQTQAASSAGIIASMMRVALRA